LTQLSLLGRIVLEVTFTGLRLKILVKNTVDQVRAGWCFFVIEFARLSMIRATVPVPRAPHPGEVLLIRPGSDAALALAVMHVIVTEKLYDAAFVGSHTIGFEELAAHVLPFTPRWGAEETCRGSQIISYARA